MTVSVSTFQSLVPNCSRFHGSIQDTSLVIAVRTLKTKLAHVHEQREFTYGAYLVATGHL